MFEDIAKVLYSFIFLIWEMPLVILLVGSGIFFLIYSRFTPFKYFKHSIDILIGKYDKEDEPGQLSHFQALSSAVAATVGFGNLSGVAAAIAIGGPGALFWMWITAIVGMATKFFTCSLSVMFRKEDKNGEAQGGPMYVIVMGLGKKWKPLAIFFALAGLVGTIPAVTANQLAQTIVDAFEVNNELQLEYKTYIGIGLSILTALVIFGGIKRIGNTSAKLVPTMVVLYFILVFWILLLNLEKIPNVFLLIFEDAFTGNALQGGVLGELIRIGVRRGALSNEAGVGTAPMMHGIAKTKEPIREGLVAMIGPAIDTLLVCTLTALAILVSGVQGSNQVNGITLTLNAFDSTLPHGIGLYGVVLIALVFGCSTLFTYSHYGITCLSFLSNNSFGKYYNWFYILSIVLVSRIDFNSVLKIIDIAFSLMAIPTLISAIWLSPKVMKSAKEYFYKLNNKS